MKAKRQISTKLSWEEKNPIDYIYHPSKDTIRLRKKEGCTPE
jgi:hypothetical protein